jgi:hypothetical protein
MGWTGTLSLESQKPMPSDARDSVDLAGNDVRGGEGLKNIFESHITSALSVHESSCTNVDKGVAQNRNRQTNVDHGHKSEGLQQNRQNCSLFHVISIVAEC